MRIDDLARRFPEEIRRRGAAYQQARVVSIKRHGAAMIRAVASGTEDYDVRIEIARRALVLSCSCPYFSSQGPCKHLWATALAAEERGLLAGMLPWTTVRLVVDDNPGDDEGYSEATPPPEPDWKAVLLGEMKPLSSLTEPSPSPSPPPRLLYVIEVERTRSSGELAVALRTRGVKQSGGFTKDKAASVPLHALELVTDELDRRALPLYQAAATITGSDPVLSRYDYGERLFPAEARIPAALAGELMPLLSETGRLFVRATPGGELVPARYDGELPWEFSIVLRRLPDGSGSEVSGALRHGDERVELSAPLVLTSSGWVVFERSVGRLHHFGAFGLLGSLRGRVALPIATSDEKPFLQSLFELPALPRLELPEGLGLREVAGVAHPVLRIGPPNPRGHWGRGPDRPTAALSFSYEGTAVAPADPRDALAQVEEGCLVRRDRLAEAAAAARVMEVGFQRASVSNLGRADPGRFDIAPAKLPGAVRSLVEAGWRVEAEGKLYRQAGRFNLSVTSGVDWFDLHAQIDFGGVAATLPDLLRAVRRGDRLIPLGDGSFGMLPEEWLKKYGLLAEMGSTTGGDLVRFQPAQVGLLDALLAAEPEVSVDALFAKARDELRAFAGIDAEKAPPGFRGDLRPYQETGLGWLSFLRRFGFGGCLADDMGLGKTVQVLAMLAARARDGGKPSLVVVPKSLVWNWEQEAARFTPELRVLAHVGPQRAGDAQALRQALATADIVLTTYGVLRKDVPLLREIEMDYVILDEAQAIKNADSESAKAARLLRGQHRLALSGTPIENHVGELWSLVEFLNPGMLGTARAFADAAGIKRPSPETLGLLTRALRPFILRRTKEQVAPDLPAKHEETIFCEMETEQRRLYDELRAHYRDSLLGKIDREGLGKSKIQVLEALLRLRQAACHPGLLDKKRAGDPSGKMEVLFARLDEVRREGHKALVFSQFTSFLALVRTRLDAAKIPYEYLDGSTRDREARVTHFQTDVQCPLFLISLKAGGVGLNLTAADYVFILDPWWNPAVEAQAVDRAHRIGQDKHVFVYRLLCRDSVEEKVAALQEEKRDLADSIINADATVMQKLDRDTLEQLLA